MNKKSNVVLSLALCVLIFVITFSMGIFIGINLARKDTVAVDNGNGGSALMQFFGISSKQKITVQDVNIKLKEIGELSTYQQDYDVTLTDEDAYFFEKYKIPFTSNAINLYCEGVVKIGYDIDDIIVEIDGKTIYVTIPGAKINDNYIVWDSIVCSERNNFLNPIDFEQYDEMIKEIEEIGLSNVEKENLYENAEKNLKKLIDAFLADFDGYTVVYK